MNENLLKQPHLKGFLDRFSRVAYFKLFYGILKIYLSFAALHHTYAQGNM